MQRKLDHGIASGLYHSEIPYKVYQTFALGPTFFQTQSEHNFKNYQIYSSGASEHIVAFSGKYNPHNIISVWEQYFAALDKVYFLGSNLYMNKLASTVKFTDLVKVNL